MHHVYLNNPSYNLSQILSKYAKFMFKYAYLLAAQQASNSRPKNGPTPLQQNEIGPRTHNHAKTLQD